MHTISDQSPSGCGWRDASISSLYLIFPSRFMSKVALISNLHSTPSTDIFVMKPSSLSSKAGLLISFLKWTTCSPGTVASQRAGDQVVYLLYQCPRHDGAEPPSRLLGARAIHPQHHTYASVRHMCSLFWESNVQKTFFILRDQKSEKGWAIAIHSCPEACEVWNNKVYIIMI